MRLRVPIIVTQTGPMYSARPLFFHAPRFTNDKLHRLLAKLTHEIIRAIEDCARQNRQDDAARWAFAPPVTAHRHAIEIELRRRKVKGKFLFATFNHLGRRLAFTPSVPDLWFEVSRGEALEVRAKAVLDEYWRIVERDADDPDTVNPVADSLDGKAWIQMLDVSASVPSVLAPPKPFTFLMLGGGESKPDGAYELRRVGRCLDWLYPDELDRAVRRDVDAVELHRLLAARDRRPVLLVGPRQVGKTAIVHETVFRRVAERSTVHARRGAVWLVSPQRLISGMSYVGQWEGRLLAILRHARKRDHVLYFDDLVGLFQAGVTSQSALSAADVLKPHLEDREVRVLGEITPDGLRVLRERDRGFADQFHILPVREPTDAETLRTLVAVQRRLEGKQSCRFGLDAIPAIIDTARRYDRTAAFPGKAAAVLERLASKLGAKPTEQETESASADPFAKWSMISRDDVLADVAARSGLSLAFLDPKRRLDRDDVRDQLAAQVVGQPAAAEALADVVSIAKARLNDPGRPLAAFLFLGPTGVGKTESAKAVARVLFGDADRLVRFDLNEFNQPGAAAKLVGTFARPDGLLTSSVRRQPFAVILLDEVEKADPEVFDVLLQVLGEGRLTDALGHTANFTNTVIILTSNLGVREAEGRLGFGLADDSGAFVRAAERFFRPEFFNRVDRVIPFSRLSRPELASIARRLVDGVLARSGFAQRNCVLDVTADALERVTDAGYDPALEARAMKRAVERELTRPAAARLAALAPDELTIITVRAGKEELAVDVQAPGWAKRIAAAKPTPVLDRIAAARETVDRIRATITALRPPSTVVGRAVTAEQERYFALKEFAGEVSAELDRLEVVDSNFSWQARQPEAVGRRSRYRSVKPRATPRWTNSDHQPFRSILSAVGMEEAIRELLETTEPADPDHDLFDLENRLALLAMMASAPVNDRPTYLWIRGFPQGTSDKPTETVAGFHRSGWTTGLGVEVLPARPVELARSDYALEVKGVHARPLALTEVGTHLVLPKHGGPVPIRVEVVDHWPAEPTDPSAFGPIVRVYPEGQPILDVRTGLVAPLPYNPDVLRAMTLAALPRG